MPADAVEEFRFRGVSGGRRIFREANPTIGFWNNQQDDRGRLPPVVSSLFSVKAAHLKRWYQRHGAGSKGQGADGKGQRAEVGDQRSESNLELRRLAQAPLQR